MNPTMTKSLLASLVISSALLSPAFAASKTDTRELPKFSAIEIRGAVDLVVEAGKKQSVTVKGDENKIDRLITEVSGNTLIIRQQGRNWSGSSIEINVGVESLDRLEIAGAADVTMKDLKAKGFELEIAGAGDVYLEGTCDSARMMIAGAGDIDARKFKCKSVDIEINGAGDADVYASESVEGSINGVGDVTVWGNPKTSRPRVNGFGSFKLASE